MKEAVRLFVEAGGAGEIPGILLMGMRGDDAGNLTAAEGFLVLVDRHGAAWIPVLPDAPITPNPNQVMGGLMNEAKARLEHRRSQADAPVSVRFVEPTDLLAVERILRHPDGPALLRAVLECSEIKSLRDFLRGILIAPPQT